MFHLDVHPKIKQMQIHISATVTVDEKYCINMHGHRQLAFRAQKQTITLIMTERQYQRMIKAFVAQHKKEMASV